MAAVFVGRALGLWDDFAAATALEMPKSVVAAGDGLELALNRAVGAVHDQRPRFSPVKLGDKRWL